MKLIVGLGNPGKQYEKTRHNFGFMVADALAQKLKLSFSVSSYKGELVQFKHAGHDKVFLLKPHTFMNLSGQSVAPLAGFYKIHATDILVIYDDIDLPLGRMRFVDKGSAGGHNGIKSLIQSLGTQNFPRLKLGIGRPIHPEHEVVDYVLQKFSKDESKKMGLVIQTAVEAAEFYLDSDLARAANRYNGVEI